MPTGAVIAQLTYQIVLQILIDKCLGRRVCKHCKRNYNVAEINIPASPGRPAIYMPPLEAPPECAPHLMQRDDDNLDTVLHRLQVSCKAPTGRPVICPVPAFQGSL